MVGEHQKCISMAIALSTIHPDVLAAKRERLNVLEVQAAQHGYDAPPHVVNEIKDLRREIAEASAPASDAERYHELRALITDLRWDMRVQYILLFAILALMILILVVRP